MAEGAEGGKVVEGAEEDEGADGTDVAAIQRYYHMVRTLLGIG